MSYTPYYPNGWQTGESGGTPITPAALNHIDDGISTNEAAIEARAEDIADINTLLGNTSMGTTATTVTGAIKEHSNKIGNTAMGTTATTLTGAIKEHETDITTLNSKIAGTFTFNSGFTTSTNDYVGKLEKNNRVVCLNIMFYTTSSFTQNAWVAIGTIPSEFRPSAHVPCSVTILGAGHATGAVYDGRVCSGGNVEFYTYGITSIPGRAIIQVSYCV